MPADVREKAFAMFAAGKKINPVAKELCKGNWPKAKLLYEQWKAENGGESQTLETSALDLARPGISAEEESEKWDVTLTLPSAQLDAILATFSPLEKATAIQNVLQARFEAALGLEAA